MEVLFSSCTHQLSDRVILALALLFPCSRLVQLGYNYAALRQTLPGLAETFLRTYECGSELENLSES